MVKRDWISTSVVVRKGEWYVCYVGSGRVYHCKVLEGIHEEFGRIASMVRSIIEFAKKA